MKGSDLLREQEGHNEEWQGHGAHLRRGGGTQIGREDERGQGGHSRRTQSGTGTPKVAAGRGEEQG